MKYASVCSGVEAASLAWQTLGWEAAWFSEIEPFPCAVLKERFPSVPNLGDMTKIRVENLENGDQRFTNGNGADVIVRGGVDLLVGGTPCQSFSVAGKREGLEGASGLAKTFVELLGSIRPKWFVWENVPGCLSSKSDRGIYDFNFLLAAFAERGYSCGWRILDAQYTRVDRYPRAVPQRRRRVFVIGHLGGWQYPAEVLFEPHSLFGNTPPRRVKGKGFTADVERSVGTASTLRMRAGCEGGGKGALVSHERSLTLAAGGNDQTLFQGGDCYNQSAVSIGNGQLAEASIMMEECSQTLNCMHDQQAVMCYENHRQDSRVKKIEGVCTQLNAKAGTGGGNLLLVQECFVKTAKPRFKGDCETYADTGVAPTVNCFDQGDKRANELVCKAVAIAGNIIGRQVQNGGNGTGAQEELVYTQNTSGVMGVCTKGNGDAFESDVHTSLSAAGGGQAGQGYACARISSTVRRLLPLECERLMGFPDNWTRIPWKGKPEEECPDSPRYKACGNSMCVNVMRWIGMRIEMIERKEQ